MSNLGDFDLNDIINAPRAEAVPEQPEGPVLPKIERAGWYGPIISNESGSLAFLHSVVYEYAPRGVVVGSLYRNQNDGYDCEQDRWKVRVHSTDPSKGASYLTYAYGLENAAVHLEGRL
jgi:hypothetical protein